MNDAMKVLACVFLLGCPADGGGSGDTDGDTDPVATSEGHLCHPGTSMPCACSDGAMGTQICGADGQSFGACECSSDEGSTSTGSSASSDGEDTTSSSGESGSDTSTGSEASSTGVETGSDSGSTTSVECEGSHPLVDGDLRYCDEGHCYCGDLRMEPPLDVCYAEAIADACCPVEIVCY